MLFDYRHPRTLFQGKRIQILSIEGTHPKGGILEREVIAHPGAVVILPLLDPERIVMIRNVRKAVQRTLLELPAGTLEPNEDPLLCAHRELIEETGYRATTIQPLMQFFPSPGICNEILFAYVAQGLEYVGQALDETEEIEVVTFSFPEVLEMIRQGDICDAKTLCTLFYFHTFQKKGS